MKMFMPMLLLSFFTGSAFAVRVKDCPEKITVSYSDLRLQSTNDILTLIQKDYRPNALERKEIKSALNVAQAISRISVKYKRIESKAGTCIYTNGTNRVVMDTSNGKDKLMIERQLNDSYSLMRIYTIIESLSPQKVVLAAKSNGVAYYYTGSLGNHDGIEGTPFIFIGNTNDVSVKVNP